VHQQIHHGGGSGHHCLRIPVWPFKLGPEYWGTCLTLTSLTLRQSDMVMGTPWKMKVWVAKSSISRSILFHCHAWVLEGNSPHEAHDLTWIVHMFSILNGGPIKVANVQWLTSVWNPCVFLTGEIHFFPLKCRFYPDWRVSSHTKIIVSWICLTKPLNFIC